ncbi:MAG TPA: tetratricopeptide repeat protein [Candidatus Angelobacter sp.]|nr:tetratricopeptide repeat protein [Candidatus Angelobacter sp.]
MTAPLLNRARSGKDSPQRVAAVLSRAPSDEGARRVATIGIHLLGTPWIEIDGERAPGPRGWKAWGLLAYLILARAPVPRGRLAELLFADADDPLGALRWNLAELRRSLGSSMALGGDPVRLSLPVDSFVDVAALGSASWVEAIQVPALGRDLLEGIDLHGGAAFETWLRAERRHVASMSGAVLHEAGSARLGMGSPDQALELATRLVALNEYDEEAHILLTRAYLALGEEERARAHLESATARIRRDLGAEPSPALLRAIEHAAQEATPPQTWVRGAAAAASLITAGEAAVSAGVLDSGLEILRRAIVVASEAGDAALEARALVVLGTAFVHSGRGRGSEGATALHAALQIAKRLSADGLTSEASRELAYLDMKQAHYERATAWLDRAIGSAPDRGSLAAAAAVKGVVTADRGMIDAGGLLLEEAYDIAIELDKPRLAAWSLAFVARGQLLREDISAARTSAARSVDLSRIAGWIAFLPFPQSLLATADLALGEVDEARAAFESAFALGCQMADPCWEGVAARGIGLIHHATGRADEAIEWLDDARTRCVRIPDAYLWMHAYCLDALCSVAIEARAPKAREWVSDLELVAARTGMNEMLVRAQLHRARLGDERAVLTARLFADRIDNPAVLGAVSALEVRPTS